MIRHRIPWRSALQLWPPLQVYQVANLVTKNPRQNIHQPLVGVVGVAGAAEAVDAAHLHRLLPPKIAILNGSMTVMYARPREAAAGRVDVPPAEDAAGDGCQHLQLRMRAMRLLFSFWGVLLTIPCLLWDHPTQVTLNTSVKRSGEA